MGGDQGLKQSRDQEETRVTERRTFCHSVTRREVGKRRHRPLVWEESEQIRMVLSLCEQSFKEIEDENNF